MNRREEEWKKGVEEEEGKGGVANASQKGEKHGELSLQGKKREGVKECKVRGAFFEYSGKEKRCKLKKRGGDDSRGYDGC